MDTSSNPSDISGLHPSHHHSNPKDLQTPPPTPTTTTTTANSPVDSLSDPKPSPFITTSRFFTPPNRLTGTSSIFSLLPTSTPPSIPDHALNSPTERTHLLDPDSDSDLEASYRSIPSSSSPSCSSEFSALEFRRKGKAKSEFIRDHIGERLGKLTGWEEVRSDVWAFWVFVGVVVVVFAAVCGGVVGIVELVGWIGGGMPGEGVDG